MAATCVIARNDAALVLLAFSAAPVIQHTEHTVHVITPESTRCTLHGVARSAPIALVRERVEATGVSLAHHRLIYLGRVLHLHETLDSIALPREFILHAMREQYDD